MLITNIGIISFSGLRNTAKTVSSVNSCRLETTEI